MSAPKYSVVVPVYNRPQELKELLDSLSKQSNKDFEVVVVEDGSSVRSESVVDDFRESLNIQYFTKPNTGPGPSRNAGVKIAKGLYVVFFDSDCIIPGKYFDAVEKAIKEDKLDAWGGPDTGHKDFTILQRAMAYTMSSVLTTGGIRGGKKSVDWFQPRSFNMGISKKVFEALGGFKFDRFAEDIEFSVRMKNAGCRVGLIPDAFVFHKRRTNFSQFFRQVHNFGRGRALVGKAHPGAIKLTHWFPSLFSLGTVAMVILLALNFGFFAPLLYLFLGYLTAIFLHAFGETGNLFVAFCAVPAALVQFFGYGLGFLRERLT